MEKNLSNFCHKYSELEKLNISFVVVTLTRIVGSAPQDIGARMIVSKDEILYGTVGGGKIESKCIEVARELISSNNKISEHTWNLQKDIGMTCGGEVSCLFEATGKTKEWNIVLFGAGHISQALTRVLLTLDCNLTVIDNRGEWLDKLPKQTTLTCIHSENMDTEVPALLNNSFVVVLTMGHALDTPILLEALKKKKPFPFLGVIGSKSKRNRIESELIEMGLSQSLLSEFYCPMGETIGNNSPSEIAISITAQLLRVRGSNPN